MENILETLQNLTISEDCFQDILEKVDRELQRTEAAKNASVTRREKVNDFLEAIKKARSGAERTVAIKNFGKAQKRVKDAESKIIKQEPKKSGITFTNKFFN